MNEGARNSSRCWQEPRVRHIMQAVRGQSSDAPGHDELLQPLGARLQATQSAPVARKESHRHGPPCCAWKAGGAPRPAAIKVRLDSSGDTGFSGYSGDVRVKQRAVRIGARTGVRSTMVSPPLRGAPRSAVSCQASSSDSEDELREKDDVPLRLSPE